jgi:hypothetical protein
MTNFKNMKISDDREKISDLADKRDISEISDSTGRYFFPWHQPTAAKRTGMSGMTLSAEGVWIPSMGRVCMVGCLGVGVAQEHAATA